VSRSPFNLIYGGIERLSEGLDRIVLLMIILLSIPLVLVVLYAVFMRYVLNMAPAWSEEVARYLMVWLALLSAAAALRRGQHIGLNFIVDKNPPLLRKAIKILAYCFILFFFLVVSIKGVSMTIFVAPQRSPSAYIPMWIPYMSVPVSSILMVVQTLMLMLKQIKTREV
jgi:TRAP-type C4-dicarboxylate transport system permease small subunit